MTTWQKIKLSTDMREKRAKANAFCRKCKENSAAGDGKFCAEHDWDGGNISTSRRLSVNKRDMHRWPTPESIGQHGQTFSRVTMAFGFCFGRFPTALICADESDRPEHRLRFTALVAPTEGSCSVQIWPSDFVDPLRSVTARRCSRRINN